MRGKRNLAILADLSQHHGDGQALKPARDPAGSLAIPKTARRGGFFRAATGPNKPRIFAESYPGVTPTKKACPENRASR